MSTAYDTRPVHRDWHKLIGGRAVEPERRYDLEDPSSGAVFASAPDCTAAEVDAAVRAAQRAQPAWAALPPRHRADALRDLAAKVLQHRDELALLDAVDGGFPLPMMRGDVDAALQLMHLFADLALDLGGRTIPVSENLRFTVQQPYGVVARLGAFNHPFLFAAAKIAGPLIAGSAVVLKAPDRAPLSSLRLAELAAGYSPTIWSSRLAGPGRQPAAHW